MDETPQATLIPPPSAVEAAKDSLFAPVIVIIVLLVGWLLLIGEVVPQIQKHKVPSIPVGALISALVAILFSGQGLRLGIKALAASKSHRRTSTFWKALAGTCINGFLILFIIFAVVVYAANTRPHTQQIQQTKQSQQ